MSSTITAFASTSMSSSSTFTPPTSISRQAYNTTQSTVAPTQTVIQGYQCDKSIESIPDGHPAFGIYSTNDTLSRMKSCCNGAPIIAYHSFCNIYCRAQNQTIQQLENCVLYSRGPIANNYSYNDPAFVAGWINNAINSASYTSLLPVETDSRCFSTATATAGPDACPYTAAGGRTSHLPGLGAWAAVVLLALSGFTGFIL